MGGLTFGAGMHQLGKATLPKFRDAVAGAPGIELVKILGRVEKSGVTIGGEHDNGCRAASTPTMRGQPC